MLGTIKKWEGIEVPEFWDEVDQAEWENPQQEVYLFTVSSRGSKADWHEIHFNMGFEDKKQKTGYVVGMPLLDAIWEHTGMDG